MKKSEHVIYIDPQGREHAALVTALNGLNQGYLSVIYIDAEAPERENQREVFDIPHFSDPARSEHSAKLPDIHLNCWKEVGEAHAVPASDHPMFDHPFVAKEKDEFGKVLEPARPEYEAQVSAHAEGKKVISSASGPAVETAKLKTFLLSNFKSETGDETPVDCAIRLLTRVKAAKK